MNSEKQAQAKTLYFQSDMSKTQIAELLNVPRRTLHYWIRENNWDRLKKSAAHMPSLLAEKCYHLIAKFSDHLLSEDRVMKPITHQEADTLHKLTLVVNKLKNRSTINESMEMFGFFMERVNQKSPELANAISPIVTEYISSRANTYIENFRPDNFTDLGLIPVEKPDVKETQLDFQDIMEWTEAPSPFEQPNAEESGEKISDIASSDTASAPSADFIDEEHKNIARAQAQRRDEAIFAAEQLLSRRKEQVPLTEEAYLAFIRTQQHESNIRSGDGVHCQVKEAA